MEKQTLEQIYLRNYGSENLYKRDYCNILYYTDGIMDFQKTLKAFWIVENVISYLPKIIQTCKDFDESFFIMRISILENNKGFIEVYREGYLNNHYNEHIEIIKQEINFIDLPKYDYKFYLILNSYNPIKFIFMLTSEY